MSIRSSLKQRLFLSFPGTLKTESANERTANRGSRAMIGAGQGIVCLRLRGNVLKECILKGNSLYSGKQSKVFDFLQTTSLNGKRGLTNEKENEFRNEKFY